MTNIQGRLGLLNCTMSFRHLLRLRSALFKEVIFPWILFKHRSFHFFTISSWNEAISLHEWLNQPFYLLKLYFQFIHLLWYFILVLDTQCSDIILDFLDTRFLKMDPSFVRLLFLLRLFWIVCFFPSDWSKLTWRWVLPLVRRPCCIFKQSTETQCSLTLKCILAFKERTNVFFRMELYIWVARWRGPQMQRIVILLTPQSIILIRRIIASWAEQPSVSISLRRVMLYIRITCTWLFAYFRLFFNFLLFWRFTDITWFCDIIGLCTFRIQPTCGLIFSLTQSIQFCLRVFK